MRNVLAREAEDHQKCSFPGAAFTPWYRTMRTSDEEVGIDEQPTGEPRGYSALVEMQSA